MASENKSVMAVCAEWRDCIEAADPSVWNDERIAGLVATTKAQQLAHLDRIEAAWRREKSEIEADALAVGGIVEAARHSPGNAAAMREALNDIVGIAKIALNVNCVGNSNYSELWSIIDKCKSALSAPPRQCDEGSAEEQVVRFKAECHKHFCNNCRLGDDQKICGIKWAQTPYAAEEGGKQ